jgi:hypothetical protein
MLLDRGVVRKFMGVDLFDWAVRVGNATQCFYGESLSKEQDFHRRRDHSDALKSNFTLRRCDWLQPEWTRRNARDSHVPHIFFFEIAPVISGFNSGQGRKQNVAHVYTATIQALELYKNDL